MAAAGRARMLLAGPLVVLGLAAAGCNTSSLTKQELVVQFTSTATPAEHAGALKACGHSTPAATPEPLPTSSGLPSQSVGDVRFRIDHASDREVAVLERCLSHQPGVLGVSVPDLGP